MWKGKTDHEAVGLPKMGRVCNFPSTSSYFVTEFISDMCTGAYMCSFVMYIACINNIICMQGVVIYRYILHTQESVLPAITM